MITPSQRVSVPDVLRAKGSGYRLSALTAYDYLSAQLIDSAGVDIILVGDSLGNVIQGNLSTLPVTLDEMVYHCRCVTRGVAHALVVGDLPFMSYHLSPKQALRSAGRLVQESGVGAVKLEGGRRSANAIRRIVDAEIPVMAHIGLTPQSYLRMGGHRIQGRRSAHNRAVSPAEVILEDARAVESAGAFSVVLEGIPAELAFEITSALSIPTIGIGAGAHCDGQILVLHDMLGISNQSPKFVKRYKELASEIREGVAAYVEDVRAQAFPESEHSYGAAPNRQETRTWS